MFTSTSCSLQLTKAQMRNSNDRNWNVSSNHDNLTTRCSLLVLILGTAFMAWLSHTNLREQQAAFQKALDGGHQQKQVVIEALNKVEEKLMERQSVSCSMQYLLEKDTRQRDFIWFRNLRNVMGKNRDESELLMMAREPALAPLRMEKGLRDIFAYDTSCSEDPDKDKLKNGCLMWVYLDYWRLLAELQKYQMAVSSLLGIKPAAAGEAARLRHEWQALDKEKGWLWFFYTNLREQQTSFLKALDEVGQQKQVMIEALNKLEEKLLERQSVFCSMQYLLDKDMRQRDFIWFHNMRNFMGKTQDESELLAMAHEPALATLGMEKGLQDIFAHDTNCAEDPDKDRRKNGCLMWVYLDYWRLHVEVQKYQMAVTFLLRTGPSEAGGIVNTRDRP